MKFPWFSGRRADRMPEGSPVDGGLGGVQSAAPHGRRLVRMLQGFAVLLAVAGYLVADNARDAGATAQQIADAGQLSTLSQRLAKGALQGLFGSADAFKHLATGRDSFRSVLKRLREGGEVDGAAIPPAPEDAGAALDAIVREWARAERSVDALLKEQQILVGLGSAVAKVNGSNPRLLELAARIQTANIEMGAGASELSASGQLVMLTQRMAKNVNALLVGETIDPAVPALLGKDAGEFRSLLDVLRRSSSGPSKAKIAARQEASLRLGELEEAFKTYEEAVASILGNMERLVAAKKAVFAVVNDSDRLLAAGEALAADISRATSSYATLGAIGAVVALMFVILALAATAFVREERARRQGIEQQEASARQRNQQNQEAILRLLNEMQTFAEGDLTVRASVNEDITGAIADSVNFAIEELRALVSRINTSSEQVTVTTQSAQHTSTQLLAAAEKQSDEIKRTSAQVLGMARAINEVSGSAAESAGVARASLSAAEKGQQAVHDSINGMNEIRDQIQETAKRIKRLGESSQEIGEIVELISDITEQTNVLALNAAIQAASAGEAGRGFTVVAEEVQRLAERSAEATKQIGAIVRTIQTDTQDAVSAMERSTQGVVAGARLADAAGQALGEIGEVSQRLAALIESISTTTRGQAEAAGDVARSMHGILQVTEQTTEGTKRTAASVAEIASLARDLRSSVANFKL